MTSAIAIGSLQCQIVGFFWWGERSFHQRESLKIESVHAPLGEVYG